MRKIITVISALIITTNLIGQSDTTKISFVSYWSVGDSYNFRVTKTNQQWKAGNMTTNQKHEYIANFTVTDSTENSYTIKWSYENDLGSSYNIPEELLDRFAKYKLTEIIYKTSELGTFQEIINWKEVSDIMNNMFDDIIEVLGEKDEKKQEALKTAMLPLKKIYSSRQGVEQLVMKELQYFHFPMGVEISIKEPLTYEEELPNMFGGKPVKAVSKLYFENVDLDEGFCTLRQEMSLDPEDTKKLLKQVFEQMNPGDNTMEEAIKTGIFQINDNNVYEYFFDPGIPQKIEAVRTTIIDIGNENAKRIDKTLIELISD